MRMMRICMVEHKECSVLSSKLESSINNGRILVICCSL